jgi:hypothetical protein
LGKVNLQHILGNEEIEVRLRVKCFHSTGRGIGAGSLMITVGVEKKREKASFCGRKIGQTL